MITAQNTMIWLAVTADKDDTKSQQEIRRELSAESTPDGVRSRLSQLFLDAQHSLRDATPDAQVIIASRYRAIARAWAETIPLAELPHALDAHGRINKDPLLRLHAALFPEGYPGRGEFRTIPVWITTVFEVAGNTTPVRPGTGRLDTASPAEIAAQLDHMLDSWNGTIKITQGLQLHAAVQRLAEFHHDFQLIHPFLDGNGRVGRSILDQQARYLFGRGIGDRLNREDYLSGLQHADHRNIEPLKAAIQNAIQSIQ